MIKKIILNIIRSLGYDVVKINNKTKELSNSTVSNIQKINKYIENGRIPWSEGYYEYKWQQIEKSINDSDLILNFKNQKKISEYGVGIDDRIFEYPWIISNLSESRCKLLDAGSTFNFKIILNHKTISLKEKTILTYYPESQNFNELGVSYIYSDLRDIPFKDCIFEEIVCQSTLEHIDMDNSMYGYKTEFNSNPSKKSYDYVKAIKELYRILKDDGVLLMTVPFGRFENHGFFQQFDKEMIEKIKSLLGDKGLFSEHYFKYEVNGWKLSDQDSCNDAQSHNPHTGIGKGIDNAAHARANCCMKFIKTKPNQI